MKLIKTARVKIIDKLRPNTKEAISKGVENDSFLNSYRNELRKGMNVII